MNNQMMQLAELHRMSDLEMKEVIIWLWPTEPIPSSYIGLVKRLADALPRVEAVKRSTCIEGARMAFACVKMHWAKMKVLGNIVISKKIIRTRKIMVTHSN